MTERPPINPPILGGAEPDRYMTVKVDEDTGDPEGRWCTVSLWERRPRSDRWYHQAIRGRYADFCAFVEWWELHMWTRGPDGLPLGDES